MTDGLEFLLVKYNSEHCCVDAYHQQYEPSATYRGVLRLRHLFLDNGVVLHGLRLRLDVYSLLSDLLQHLTVNKVEHWVPELLHLVFV